MRCVGIEALTCQIANIFIKCTHVQIATSPCITYYGVCAQHKHVHTFEKAQKRMLNIQIFGVIQQSDA